MGSKVTRDIRLRSGSWLWLLALVPAMVLLATGAVSSELDSLKACVYSGSAALAMAFFALVTAARGADSWRGLRLPVSFLAYAVFLALSSLSLLWSRSAFEADALACTAAANLALLFILGNSMPAREDGSRLVLVLVSALLAISLVGFAERGGLLVPYGAYSRMRIISTMGNSGYLGAVLGALFPACVVMFFLPGPWTSRRGRRAWTILAMASGAGCLAALFLTGTRAAMVACLAGIGMMLLLRPWKFRIGMIRAKGEAPHGETAEPGLPQRAGRKRRATLIAIALLLLFLLALVVAFSPSFFAVIRPGEAGLAEVGLAGTLENRVAAWKAALLIWQSEGARSILLGTGPGSYYPLQFHFLAPDHALTADFFSFRHAHNEFLELLADGGLLSLLSWLAFLAVVAARTLALRRRGSADAGAGSAPALLSTMALSGLAALLVDSLADPALRSPAVACLFYFLAGIPFAFEVGGEARGEAVREKAVRGKAARWSGGRAGIVAASLLVALCAIAFARTAWRLGTDALLLAAYRGRSAAESEASLDAALARDPDNVFALYEKLAYFDREPAAALATADRIEGAVPGFRQLSYIRGMALAAAGRYKEAELAFSRELSQDSFSLASWAGLAASQSLLGDRQGLESTLRGFFLAYHRYSTERKDRFWLVPRRELRIDPASAGGLSADADGSPVAILGLVRVAVAADRILEASSGSWTRALQEVFIAMGRMSEELDYGDLPVFFFDCAASLGTLDPDLSAEVLDLDKTWYARASVTARTSANPAEVRKARTFQSTYYRYITRFQSGRSFRVESLTR